MWVRSVSKLYTNITKEQIWSTWSDTKNWHLWDPDIEYCRMEGSFVAGTDFVIKPKHMGEVTMKLVAAEKNKMFTDYHQFFGAKMWGMHTVRETDEGLELTVTMKVSGILSFLWIYLVARGIVAAIPEQLDNLVKYARSCHE